MKNQPFGLDIGATTMKVVSLQEQRKGFLLKAARMLPSPQKGMMSESPLDQEEMAQAIKNLVSEAKIGTNLVNVALAEHQVYTKVVEMPVLSDAELGSAIYWEAEQYVPVPLNTVTLDYTVLKKPDKPHEGSKMDVLMVAAPTNLINKYQKIISMAGLELVAVETEILSAVRALIPSEKAPPTLILNIGAMSTSIAIIRQGIVVFTYSIPTGGSAISRAIAADFGFSIPQAEEYKKVYGITNQANGGKLGKATLPIIEAIFNEIKKAIAFYNDKYKNEETIAQILLAGGSAKLPGIDLFFAQNIGVETAIANPWKMLVEQNVPKDVIDNAVDYTIAVGLALRDYAV